MPPPNCKVFLGTEEMDVKAVPEWFCLALPICGGTLRRVGKCPNIRKEGFSRPWEPTVLSPVLCEFQLGSLSDDMTERHLECPWLNVAFCDLGALIPLP